MLRSLKELERYAVSASDGDIGTVVNFLVDDDRWVVRYLVVDTDGFFDSRRVLVSPISFGRADWSSLHFHVALTREKVKNSLNIDVDKPVSRQHERDYHGYYGYPRYWGYPGVWGTGTHPQLLADGDWSGARSAQQAADAVGDAHLRSASEIRGCHIRGTDETIGHVEDIIVDDETWQVRYLVIDTSNWWFGKKVLVAPHWATRISWEDRMVHVDMSREDIKNSPEWHPTAGLKRTYETELHDHYGRPVYWDDTAIPTPRLPVATLRGPPSTSVLDRNDGRALRPARAAPAMNDSRNDVGRRTGDDMTNKKKSDTPKSRVAEAGRLRQELEAAGGLAGGLAGGAMGAVAGPPGAVAGAVIGGIIGAVSAKNGAAARSERDRELDEEIAVSGGALGPTSPLAKRGLP